jgi:3-hydroxyisobutyrate dehydrogenase-like beta-hydroxyacid dehydrogenase
MNSHKTFDTNNLAIIGFGEAAQAFVQGWRGERYESSIRAYDIKTGSDDPLEVANKTRDFETFDVVGKASASELLENSLTVFSLVTADQAHIVACEAAKSLLPGAFFFDGNSCSPKTKQENAAQIENAGGHYVDMAIMSPVHPKLHKTPILLSGAHAQKAQEMLAALGMDSKVEAGDVGRASSIKMVRSIMVKGLEALMAECLLAGRRAGVEDIVLESLEKSWPGFGWSDRAAYNLERMMVHGERRAAEMREVARTIEDLGLDNGLARATAAWQQNIGELGLDAGPDALEPRLDAVLAKLGQNGTDGDIK